MGAPSPHGKKGWFNFSGYIHSRVILRDLDGQSLKLPCFFHNENQIILPAFGEFTGKYLMKAELDDIIYAIANDDIFVLFGKS